MIEEVIPKANSRPKNNEKQINKKKKKKKKKKLKEENDVISVPDDRVLMAWQHWTSQSKLNGIYEHARQRSHFSTR